MSRLPDPIGGFRFVVEVGGRELGGFSQASGVEVECTVEEYKEGGRNDFVHRLLTSTKHPVLSLKRGITDDDELWQWHREVVRGDFERNDVTVVLRDEDGNDRRRWIFQGAYPIKWSGSELDASTSKVFVSTVEFAHQGVVD